MITGYIALNQMKSLLNEFNIYTHESIKCPMFRKTRKVFNSLLSISWAIFLVASNQKTNI